MRLKSEKSLHTCPIRVVLGITPRRFDHTKRHAHWLSNPSTPALSSLYDRQQPEEPRSLIRIAKPLVTKVDGSFLCTEGRDVCSLLNCEVDRTLTDRLEILQAKLLVRVFVRFENLLQ